MARVKKGRRVRCCVTGEYGTDLTFFKAPDGKYYQSEQLYSQQLARAESHRQLIDEFARLFGYYEGQVFPTSLTRKLKELDFYGDEVILQTTRKCSDKIRWALETHDFQNEYQMVAYVMAIIRNNINDVYKQYRREEKARKQKEASSVPDIIPEVELQSVQQKSKDISQFLEDIE